MKTKHFYLFILLLFLAGCSLPPAPQPPSVRLLYPKPDTTATMGQQFKFIAQVTDTYGNPAANAQVSIIVQDPDGKVVAQIPTTVDTAGTARSDSWTIPHLQKPGTWTAVVRSTLGAASGETSGSFQVQESTSEILLSKYGFWLDAPSLNDIVPQIMAERGDAQNGMILWGGTALAQHVFPENWVQVQWRKGNFHLDSAEAVRSFMLDELGDLGPYPVRDIGPFEPVKFKQWDAWQVGGRGLVERYQVQWMLFYSPEMDETYSIGTTVVLPPTGIDPHAYLRSSFEVHPELHANGVAPDPLPRLLPGPELVSPAMGERFVGLNAPVTLRWKPVKELAKDEYYQVRVDFNYKEGNPSITLTTRQTQIDLPETIYKTPNCEVFNWQVTLMRQIGTNPDGSPQGQALSYRSLYRYLFWSYPPNAPAPFSTGCQNAQY